ncbi:ABC transporter substrate-binding protein [Lactococcus hodotermopsidis]|uniref:ABC transporter substrate-binding protein n=1 Tax=Pseudolactococcus hodotermopsidis TaxID=2709157 RepID=A0A6A0BCU6_9LACT|nr:ABC transporter substrate-binding protein [Lactococcus hodotermopsidis]GFH43212.1 ABC transporter substrate-binding protein [Lactococcus hodotermopsidis]
MNQDYFRLRATFPRQKADFRLKELESIWYLSSKQVKRRLLKFQEKGWLTYEPGHGRGHLSKLSFKTNFKKQFKMELAHALQTKNAENLLFLLELPLPLDWLRDFQAEIQDFFDFKHTNTQNEPIVLRKVLSRPITTLNPTQTAILHEHYLIKQLGDTLVEYKNDTLTPLLAHHFTADNAYQKWTFFLRKGVKFHNGKVMTSLEVKQTIEQIRHELGHDYYQFENLIAIECPSNHTIIFKLNQPERLFARYLADIKYVIRDIENETTPENWIGTGAFKITEKSDKKLKLTVNEHYFGYRPFIDEVDCFVADLPKFSTTLFDPNQYSDIAYSKKIQQIGGAEFLICNMNRKTIIQNQLIRQAIYEVLDMSQFKQRKGIPASHYFSKDSQPPQKSLTKAKHLLKKAHYQGEKIKLATLAHFKDTITLGKWVTQRANAIGLRIELTYFTFENDYYSDYLVNDIDCVLLGDIPTENDELAYLEFVSNHNLLIQRMLSTIQLTQLQKMIRHFKSQPSQLARHQTYLEIDKWLTSNYYLIYTVHPVREVFTHPMLQDVKEDYDYKTAWSI